MKRLKNKKCVSLNIIIIIMLIYQADQVKTNEELNLFNNLNLQKAKQFRDDIVDYINKAQLLLKDVDEMVLNQIVNITESDKLNEENYNLYVKQVKNFENSFDKIRLEFQENNSSDDIYAIKNRGMALKNEMNLLKSNLDESTIKGLKYLNHYYGNETIMSRYENLTNSANELIDNIIEKEQSVREINCINAIKMKNFELAELQLNEIIDDKRIISIVNKTYSGISNNYYLIIKFGEHISNLTRSFFIFNELNNELRQNSDTTINKFYTLIKSLTTKIVNDKVFDNVTGTEAIILIDSLKTDLKTIGIKHLADILEEKEIKYSEINELSKIFSLDRKLALDMFNESYHSSNDKINLVKKFREISQILLKENLQDSEALFNYILFIKEFFIKIDQKEFIDECLKIIKDSSNASELIKTILFAKKVCISIKGSNSLFGVKDNKTHLVLQKYLWWLNNTHDNIFEINHLFTNDSMDLVKENSHEIVLSKRDKVKNNLWKLEPTHDYVYIKNLNNNEYWHEKSNKIYTGEFENTLKYQWKIRDCSDCSEYDHWDASGKCVDPIKWIATTNANLPKNAVLVGTDKDGGNLYAGRVVHEGYTLPAKIVPNQESALISYAGNELRKNSYEVLTSDYIEWKPSEGGAVPPEAVKVGRTPDGKPIFMGRAKVENSFPSPGRIDQDCGCLIVPFGGSEKKFTSYEVLVHKLN
ncbi:hypothetical protein O3M35_010348 [Rhynocoris fuscipes]|uniref:Uncharacterized protein n=1 Tax=Rhynocoris fuscipes TaxID=488301 RepID=A0AAW1D013_9HEMI